MPGDDYVYDPWNLKSIPFEDRELTKKWYEYDIHHELTDKGMEQFSADWNNLITQIQR
jgi:transaldolase